LSLNSDAGPRPFRNPWHLSQGEETIFYVYCTSPLFLKSPACYFTCPCPAVVWWDRRIRGARNKGSPSTAFGTSPFFLPTSFSTTPPPPMIHHLRTIPSQTLRNRAEKAALKQLIVILILFHGFSALVPPRYFFPQALPVPPSRWRFILTHLIECLRGSLTDNFRSSPIA